MNYENGNYKDSALQHRSIRNAEQLYTRLLGDQRRMPVAPATALPRPLGKQLRSMEYVRTYVVCT